MDRRGFLEAAYLSSVLSAAPAICQTRNNSGRRSETQALRNAAFLGDRLIEWQSPYGSTDLEKCPYRTPGLFNAVNLRPNGPANRALYQLYEATGTADYKKAADRYVTLSLAAIHDPLTPYVYWTMLNGHAREYLSAAWMYGSALSSYASFRRHNPNEDCFELRAYAIHRDLQRHRHPDSYFGAGYPAVGAPDAQFACDLAEVGGGLVSFYEVSNYRPALDDALGLARFFLTEWQEGSGRGVWSSKLGTWLAGPWPVTDTEEFANRQLNQVGWVPSAHMVAAEFLLRLHPHVEDAKQRDAIADKCRKACKWTFENCQFEDGAIGLFGRDDKWVGMSASAVLHYLALEKSNLISAEFSSEYRPRAEKSWHWLVANTERDTFPADGYIRATETTAAKPIENLVSYLCYGIEALIRGYPNFQ